MAQENIPFRKRPTPIPVNVGPVIQPKNPKEKWWTITKLLLSLVVLGFIIWLIIFGRSGDRFSHQTAKTAQGTGVQVTINVENLTPLEKNGEKFYRVWLHAGAAGSPTSFELCYADVPYVASEKEIATVLCPIPHPQKNDTGLLSLTIDYTHDQNCSTDFVYTFKDTATIDYYNAQVTEYYKIMTSRDPFSFEDSEVMRIENIPDFLAKQVENWQVLSQHSDAKDFPFVDFIGQKVCFDLKLINPYNVSIQRLAYNHVVQFGAVPKTPEEINKIVQSGSSNNDADEFSVSLIFKDQASYEELTLGDPQRFPSVSVLNNNEEYTQWYNSLKTYRIYGYYMGNSYFYCTGIEIIE